MSSVIAKGTNTAESFEIRHLRLQGGYTIQRLLDVKLHREAGEHARLWIRGLLPENRQEESARYTTGEQPIALEQWDDQGKRIRILFQGMVQSFSVQTVHGVNYVEIEAVSYSALLDIAKRTRSFQQNSVPAVQVLRQVMSAYTGWDLIDQSTGGAKLGKLTVQYQETDWAFMKRIASRHGAKLIVESAAASPKLWIGLPEGQVHTVTRNLPYTVSRDMEALAKARQQENGRSVYAMDYTCYELEAGDWWQLGDNVHFQDKELTVAAATTELAKGLIVHRYRLQPEGGLHELEQLHPGLVGASLDGKILEVKQNQVRVHLKADAEQPTDKASWIPYSAVYSSKKGGGFNVMPEKGDGVQVYFPSAREDEAIAMSSVRQGGGAPSPKLSDPNTKYWGTSFGKEVKFGASEMSLTATEGKLYITLENGEGIRMESDTGIAMRSKQDLELTAEKKLILEPQEGLYLLCGESSIVMDGNTDIQGSVVSVEGSTKAAVEIEDLEPQPEVPLLSEIEIPEPEPEPPKKKGFWEKALDWTQTALDVVGMVPGIGTIANVVNAGIHVARGNYLDAGMCMLGAIPFAGTVVKGAKLIAGGAKMFKAGQKATQAVTKAVDAVKKARDALKAAQSPIQRLMSGSTGKVVTNARSLTSNLSNLEQVQRVRQMMDVMAAKSPKLMLGLQAGKEAAWEYTKAKSRERLFESGGMLESVGNWIDEHGGDNLRAAMLLTSLMSGGKSKRGSGSNHSGSLGFANVGGNGSSNKKGSAGDSSPGRQASHDGAHTPATQAASTGNSSGKDNSNDKPKAVNSDSGRSNHSTTDNNSIDPNKNNQRNNKSEGTREVSSGRSNSDEISKGIKKLDVEIERLKREGKDKEVKRLTRERNKLANKLDTKDVISDQYDLKAAKEYERKIDNSKHYSHDKGEFGEEVTKIVARDSNLGQDVSGLFQVGRNGIDAAFLSKGPPPRLTIIESKASDSASFSYSKKQKEGGDKYFQGMINSNDSRYAGFGDKLEELMEENPGLKLNYIRVETDIKITKTGFGVDELKVKEWDKKIH